MDVASRKPMSIDEFLRWEARQELRYEFDGFAPVAMTGGTAAQDRITFNLGFALEQRLRPPCEAHSTEIKIEVAGRMRYPDVLVTCHPPRPADTIATDPLSVFEVISDGNPATDRIVKFNASLATPSIQRSVILEQTAIGATVLTRQGDAWLAKALRSDGTLELPEVGVEMPLDACCARLSFDPEPDRDG